MKGSQQQSRIFHEHLEHKEDGIILIDKAEWKNLHLKNTYRKRAGLEGEAPFPVKPWRRVPNQGLGYKEQGLALEPLKAFLNLTSPTLLHR